jgi:hypothetical protein
MKTRDIYHELDVPGEGAVDVSLMELSFQMNKSELFASHGFLGDATKNEYVHPKFS